MPKVSVIIPTHNRPKLLKRAIQSVLSQTFQDFEIIVVDDGDISAEEIIKNFNQPQKIIYTKNKRKRGGSGARNTGIILARGKYIAFLDDDDEWLPEKLELQTKALDNSGPGVGFSFTAVYFQTEKQKTRNFIKSGPANFFGLALRNFHAFYTVTLMIKREVFKAVGLFDERFPSHQEAELMIRVARQFWGLAINRPLTIVNMAISHNQLGKAWDKRIEGRKLILEKHFNEFSKHPTVLARHYFRLAIFYRNNHQFREARNAFRLSWRTKFSWRALAHYFLVGDNFLYNFLKKL